MLDERGLLHKCSRSTSLLIDALEFTFPVQHCTSASSEAESTSRHERGRSFEDDSSSIQVFFFN